MVRFGLTGRRSVVQVCGEFEKDKTKEDGEFNEFHREELSCFIGLLLDISYRLAFLSRHAKCLLRRIFGILLVCN